MVSFVLQPGAKQYKLFHLSANRVADFCFFLFFFLTKDGKLEERNREGQRGEKKIVRLPDLRFFFFEHEMREGNKEVCVSLCFRADE